MYVIILILYEIFIIIIIAIVIVIIVGLSLLFFSVYFAWSFSFFSLLKILLITITFIIIIVIGIVIIIIIKIIIFVFIIIVVIISFFSAFDGLWTVQDQIDPRSGNYLGVKCLYGIFVKPNRPVPVAALEWKIQEEVLLSWQWPTGRRRRRKKQFITCRGRCWSFHTIIFNSLEEQHNKLKNKLILPQRKQTEAHDALSLVQFRRRVVIIGNEPKQWRNTWNKMK